VFGYKRGSNGNLTAAGGKLTNDATPPSGVRLYIPSFAAADPTNHVAFTMQRASPPTCDPGPLQMGSFTVDSSGNLSTTNTYSNMPATLVTTPADLKMSPSGKLLAIGGQQGLQIFHFNGASPMTHYTDLIITAPVNQMFWDNANHLYAISQSTGRVYAFTITPTGWKAAPGSPHALPTPYALIVQPH
jgi:hypothetical protein